MVKRRCKQSQLRVSPVNELGVLVLWVRASTPLQTASGQAAVMHIIALDRPPHEASLSNNYHNIIKLYWPESQEDVCMFASVIWPYSKSDSRNSCQNVPDVVSVLSTCRARCLKAPCNRNGALSELNTDNTKQQQRASVTFVQLYTASSHNTSFTGTGHIPAVLMSISWNSACDSAVSRSWENSLEKTYGGCINNLFFHRFKLIRWSR